MITNFFSEGCNPVIDFIDKFVKNTFLPPLTSPFVEDLTNFTITWIQSWDPVRKVTAGKKRERDSITLWFMYCVRWFHLAL